MQCIIEKLKTTNGNTQYYILLCQINGKIINKYIASDTMGSPCIERFNYGFPFSESEILDPTSLNNFGSFNYLELKYHKEEYLCILKFYKRIRDKNLKIFI